MDTVTQAIISAVTYSLANVGSQAVRDAYQGLRALIVRKFGGESRLIRAVDDVESDPESKAFRSVLEEQVAKVDAAQDADIREAASRLLSQVGKLPNGEQHIMTITGNYNAQ